MPRRNFLQILQDAKIDIKREYQRLFDLICFIYKVLPIIMEDIKL